VLHENPSCQERIDLSLEIWSVVVDERHPP
jgi:hypothetical protein